MHASDLRHSRAHDRLPTLSSPTESPTDESAVEETHQRPTVRAMAAVMAELVAQSRVVEREPAPSDDPPTLQGAPEVDLLVRAGGGSIDVVDMMRALYASGDAAGALAIASLLNSNDAEGDRPAQANDAEIFAQLGLDEIPLDEKDFIDCEASPRDEKHTKGDDDGWNMDAVPVLRRWSGLVDLGCLAPNAPALIALVDGSRTLKEILDRCGSPEKDALLVLGSLAEWGVLEIT